MSSAAFRPRPFNASTTISHSRLINSRNEPPFIIIMDTVITIIITNAGLKVNSRWACSHSTLDRVYGFRPRSFERTNRKVHFNVSISAAGKAVPDWRRGGLRHLPFGIEANEKIRSRCYPHYFHAECIDRWLMTNKKCPVCRLPIDSNLRKQSTNSGLH